MKKLVLVACGLALIIAGCEKKPKDGPIEFKNVLASADSSVLARYKAIPDSIRIVRKDVPSSILSRPEIVDLEMRLMSIDTSTTPVRTTPDFTDAGVGMLITNAASAGPTTVSTCVVPGIQSWLAEMAAGRMSATLSLPDPMTPAESCSSGAMVAWKATAGQRCSWNLTISTVSTMFVNAIRSYEGALLAEGYSFPCTVVGLDYGRALCSGYLKVQIQRILDSESGRIIEYRIVIDSF